jgi:hypothetical protein
MPVQILTDWNMLQNKLVFSTQQKDSAVAGSPFADYSIIGINNERISVAIAGVLGVGLTALISFGLFSFIKRK